MTTKTIILLIITFFNSFYLILLLCDKEQNKFYIPKRTDTNYTTMIQDIKEKGKRKK